MPFTAFLWVLWSSRAEFKGAVDGEKAGASATCIRSVQPEPAEVKDGEGLLLKEGIENLQALIFFFQGSGKVVIIAFSLVSVALGLPNHFYTETRIVTE